MLVLDCYVCVKAFIFFCLHLSFKILVLGLSLVAQWLRIYLAMQGM